MTKLSFLFLFMTLHLYSQQSDYRLNGLEIEVENLMKAYKTIGVSVAIVENNKLVYSKGFGYRDFENKLPVDPNTLFSIGSITKQFTASLIGIYEAKGELSVFDKPKKHIDYLQFYSDEMNNLITIEDLLTHNSGIGVVDGTHVFFPTNNIKKHLQRLPYLLPNSKIREKFDYSNMGYAILGAIGESITHKSWSNNITQDIFMPLQMSQSCTNLNSLQKNANFSYGYGVGKRKNIIKVLYEDQYESAASGGVNSTASDMAKWMLMLLNKGNYKNSSILPKEFIERSFSEHNIIRTSFSFDKKYNLLNDAYGYGWFTHNYKGLFRVNHEGNVSGFTSSINLYPYKKLGIVVLTNQGSANLLNKAITDIITNRMLNLKRKDWNKYKVNYGEATDFNTPMSGINKNKKPSHSLSEFSGKYTNKGYGTLKVTIINDTLMVTFPAFKMSLAHQYFNVFVNKRISEIHQNIPQFYFNFLDDNDGKISKLTINMQAKPIVFTKNNN
ncbi:MAG: serine hydrolase [Cellulophaga sp.]